MVRVFQFGTTLVFKVFWGLGLSGNERLRGTEELMRIEKLTFVVDERERLGLWELGQRR